MKIGIYKDTLANRRGADMAVENLASALQERGARFGERGMGSGEWEVVLFEEREFEARMKERWDVVISTGTNELLDLYDYFSVRSTRSTRLPLSPVPHFPFPIIQQFHTNPKSQFKWKRFVRNWKIRRALRHVAAIQVLREEVVRQVAKYGPPVSVIGNWSEWEGRARMEPPRGQTIIYPAVWGRGKNQRLAVESFASVSKDFPGWSLELYGNGTPTFPLPEGVVHKGYCDLGAVYASCAFVAFPSLDEGFPLTLVDAAAFGRPAVTVCDWVGAAAVGGGIVAEPTVASYSAALRRLMSSEELRCEMGRVANRFCLERYSRKVILDKWETLLESVVK